MAAGLFAIVILLASDDMNLVAVVDSDPVAPVETEEVLTMHPEFPWGRLALEMAVMIGFTLAIAAVTSRRSESEPGRIATGVMLGVYASTWMIPEAYQPWASPTEQRWATSAIWWWVALAIVWGLAAILSWDSRAGHLHSRRRGSIGRANPTSRVGPTHGRTGQ
jgi:hypothetical protein